jgi:RNA polymerase sigma-70 factor (sigma-E family)
MAGIVTEVTVRDDDEFVAFVEQSGSRLCDTAFWLCRDWSLAQDLTQAALVKVYQSWHRITGEDPYWYGKQVLLRTYLDHKRRKSSAEVQTDVVPDRPTAADTPELRVTLLDALGHLSPRDRAIIVLRYWEDHSVQTVAELLGVTPGVVKTQSMRALASLRAILGEDDPLAAPPVRTP